MTSTLHTCVVDKCENVSLALCNCCKNHLCLDHLTEHSNRLNAQLPLIADEINQLVERLDTVDLTKIPCFKQLEEWKQAAHRIVDAFYEKKRRELIDNIHQKQQRQKLADCRNQLNELIRRKGGSQENIDALKNTLSSIERTVQELQHTQLILHPLVIDDKLVTFSASNRNIFPLATPHKTIESISPHFFLLASNKQYLLIDTKQNLCLLDQNLKMVKETTFNHGNLWDMFWCSTLALFILITEQEIFMLDELRMKVQLCMVASNNTWARGTSSDTTLFLSTKTDDISPFIHEYTLVPSIAFVRKRQIPPATGVDNAVRDINFQNDFFALIRGNWEANSKTCLELRSSNTLACLWSIPVATAGRCCSINGNNWLVVDYYQKQLLRVSSDGIVLEENEHMPPPTDALQWDDYELVVRTQNRINLYKIH